MGGGRRRSRAAMVADALESRRLMAAKLVSVPLPPALTSAGYDPSLERALAVGPVGNLWVEGATTGPVLEGVGEITAAGTVTAFPLSSTAPAGQLTVGPDGALWFDAIGAIGRVSAAGTLASLPLASPYVPSGIAAGGDGDLWFLDGDGAHIDRMTMTGRLTQFPAPSAGAVGLGWVMTEEMTRGADGNIWYLANATPGEPGPATTEIARVTPNGQVTVFPVLRGHGSGAGTQLDAIATGPDGNVWFVGNQENGLPFAGRITPKGKITLFPIPSVGATLTPSGSTRIAAARPDEADIALSIAPGPDGALWFNLAEDNFDTGPAPDPVIGRITTSGKVTLMALPPSIGGAESVATGPGGTIRFVGTGASLPDGTQTPEQLVTLTTGSSGRRARGR